MKKGLFSFFILLTMSAAGQKQLYLHNMNSGKYHHFKLKTSFNYRLADDKKDHKGILKQVADASILVDFELAEIHKIHMVRRMTGFHQATRIIGAPMVVAGIPGAITYTAWRNQIGKPLRRDVFIRWNLLGLGTTLLGLMPFIIPKKAYYLGDKFELIIR